ncbi:MAG: EAL domain-containing protein [Actinobacteria bacterium]|nr:EAL domain-containing protein [Actinomycetota bacterium]
MALLTRRERPGRSGTDRQVAELLATARQALGLSVAFLSRLDGTTQHIEVVEASGPASLLFREGATQVQATSLCQAILDGELPPVIPDLTRHDAGMKLPAARMPRIRSYVSVPVRLSDGRLYGTFCAAGLTTDKALTKRDQALMEVLARAAAVVLEPEVVEHERRSEIEDRILPVIERGGPVVVVQPIVDLVTGRRVGAEALSRFPAEWGLTPDVVFAQAHSVGLGHELELLALMRAAEHLDEIGGYVAMNLSPATLQLPQVIDTLSALDAPRVLLELSEHDPVDDYDELSEAIEPLRHAGMRLAVDDVGAGFSSLRHIVLAHPDVIKLDRSLVHGVCDDPVLSTLVRSLVDFGHTAGATVVAEGIEDAREADALRALGVDHGQGWHFGRPGPASDLAPADGAGAPARTQV